MPEQGQRGVFVRPPGERAGQRLATGFGVFDLSIGIVKKPRHPLGIHALIVNRPAQIDGSMAHAGRLGESPGQTAGGQLVETRSRGAAGFREDCGAVAQDLGEALGILRTHLFFGDEGDH